MMNRRDFMKLSAASAVTMGAVAGMAPASFAENAGVHTDAEVQAMVDEELRLSRAVAFYPAAFRGDFDKFYVLFHKLSRAQYEKVDGAPVPGINASHYDMCVALTNARKALRQMKLAQKFNRPVISFIDTSGAYCGIGAEERGQAQAIAENLMEMMTLKVPIISIFTGEGESGGALGLAVADEVWMLENAVYSVISPEGCATILWKDAAKAEQAAEELKLTADDALALGVVESVIPEAGLGEPEFYDALAQRLMREVDALTEMPIQELLSARYARFRRFGGEAQR